MNLQGIEPLIPFIIIFTGTACAGYLIVRFIMMPFLRYRKIKKNIIAGMTGFLEYINCKDINNYNLDNPASSDNSDITGNSDIPENTDCIEHPMGNTSDCKILSNELEKFYHIETPGWFRSVLEARGEFPDDAALHLKGLSQTGDTVHAWKRIKKVLWALRIG
jgi:hypothetical protein